MFGFQNKKEKGVIDMPKKEYEGKEPDFYFGDSDKSFYIECNGRFKNSIQTALINDYDDLDKFCQKLNLGGKDIEIKVKMKGEYQGQQKFVQIVDVCSYTVPVSDLTAKKENDFENHYELFERIQRDAIKKLKTSSSKRQFEDYEDDEEDEEDDSVLGKLGQRINELITPDMAESLMEMAIDKIFGAGETQQTQTQAKQIENNRVNKIFNKK